MDLATVYVTKHAVYTSKWGAENKYLILTKGKSRVYLDAIPLMNVRYMHAHYSGSREGHHTLVFHHKYCWVILASSGFEGTLSTPLTKLAMIKSKLLHKPSFNWQYPSWNVSLTLDQN